MPSDAAAVDPVAPPPAAAPAAPAAAPVARPAQELAPLLAEVRSLALERFPREARTLQPFFEELARRLEGDEKAGSFSDLLDRLEELCEALLVGEAHGLQRR